MKKKKQFRFELSLAFFFELDIYEEKYAQIMMR